MKTTMDRHYDGSTEERDRTVDPGGFGREPVHGSTYDRGAYGHETGSGRNYPGSRGRRDPGYSRGPYVPGPPNTGYGQHETRSNLRGPAGYESGGYGPGRSPESAPHRYEGRHYGNVGAPRREDYGGSWAVPGPHVGRGPAGYARSDDRIREDVCERLTWHGELDASNVRVGVQNSEVTLEGTVESRRTKRLADDRAASVRGVRDVHNHLRIPRAGDEAAGTGTPSG